MGKVGATTTPVTPGARNAPLVDLLVEGLLDYSAHLINRVSAAADKIIPRDEADLTTTPFELVPAANRFSHNPHERRKFHAGFPIPSLWVWWDGTSKLLSRTVSYKYRERKIKLLYVFDELPDEDFVQARAGLFALIEAELMLGSSSQWQPDYSFNGAPLGTSLTHCIADHDSLDWEYTEGIGVPRVGAYDASESMLGEKDSGRDFPAFAAYFTAHERIASFEAVPAGQQQELQDSRFLNTVDGVPIFTGVVTAPDGADTP